MCCLAVFNGGICQDHQPRVTWKSMAGQVSLQWMVSKSTSWIQFQHVSSLLLAFWCRKSSVGIWSTNDGRFPSSAAGGDPLRVATKVRRNTNLRALLHMTEVKRDGSAVVRWRRMAILEAKKTSDGCFMVDQCMLCIHRMFTMFYYGWSMHVMYT